MTDANRLRDVVRSLVPDQFDAIFFEKTTGSLYCVADKPDDRLYGRAARLDQDLSNAGIVGVDVRVWNRQGREIRDLDLVRWCERLA
jgi:hypothetical protein